MFGAGALGSEAETDKQAQTGTAVQSSLLSSGAIAESGLRFLGTFDDGGGFVAFTNNVRPIMSVADIEGLRIRVEENPAHVATMKALGASATPLPWGEVLTALGTGLADGQELQGVHHPRR